MFKKVMLMALVFCVSSIAADFTQFLGENRNGIVNSGKNLLKKWPGEGLKEFWRLKVGSGYAAPVVVGDKMFFLDYDLPKEEDVLRCLNMKDGSEVWKYGYPSKIKPTKYDYSRTVPAVSGKYIVTFGTSCMVSCLEKDSGKLLWQKDLVKEYGAKIPTWAAGQNPLIDGGKVVILISGDKVQMAAFDLASGKVIWETPWDSNAGLTHNSITAMTLEGEKFYIGCSKKSTFGVSAANGKLLWEHPGWTVKTANIPAPLVIGKDRIFLTGGYGGGSLILGLKKNGTKIETEEIVRIKAKDFGSHVHTPILYKSSIYGVSGGELTCMDLDGKVIWKTKGAKIGLGSYLIIDDLLYVLGEKGMLLLVEPSPSEYKEISRFQALTGEQIWSPLTLSGSKLIVRSMTEMVCLELEQK